MGRFEDACLLGNVAREGPLSPARSVAVADTIWESHRLAPPSRVPDASRNVEAVAAEIAAGLGELDPTGAQARAFAALSRAQLDRVRDLLDRRGQAGFVRRCHGDLHLDNIVLWDGVPTLFDALEFDEKLATVDTLYDLAFLLMDLAIRGQDGAASTILNRYLWRSDAPLDLEGLAALPLFLALRAGIRAMVLEERAALQRTGDAAKAEASHALARAYLASALRFLEPPPPRLVAVGGLSGTGKSTLAMGLAPRLGAYPGAVVLRSDLERKSLLGAAETERLPQSAYAPSVTAEVYRRLRDKARLVLRAGHTAIIDAVHAKPGEREGSAAVARDLAIPFDGIWLSSPPEVMIARVEARRDDASDADADVVRHQLARPVGAVDWHPIEAGDDRAHVLARALAVLKAA